MNMSYKTLGDIGQNCVIGHLARFGVGVAVPLSDNYPYDLIILGKTPLRAQVKASSFSANNGSIFFDLSTNNYYTGETKKYTEDEIDIYICYDLVRDKVYVLSHNDVSGQKCFTIRYSDAIGSRKYQVNLEQDFILNDSRVKSIFGIDPIVINNYCIRHSKTQHKHICKQCKSEFTTGSKIATFCGKECSGLSKRKVERPTKEELELLIASHPLTSIGEKFGISDNAVRKWMIFYGIKS